MALASFRMRTRLKKAMTTAMTTMMMTPTVFRPEILVRTQARGLAPSQMEEMRVAPSGMAKLASMAIWVCRAAISVAK